MIRHSALTLLVLLLGASQVLGELAPAFLWSSQPLAGHSDATPTGLSVSYETTSSAAIMDSILDRAESKIFKSGTSPLNLVVILLQGQATKSEFNSKAQSAETEFLQQSLKSASSSVYFANVQVGTSVDVDDALQLGNCKGAQGLSESELEIALGARNGRSVVSVCEDTSFEVISQLQDSLQSKSMPYLVAYTGQSDKEPQGPSNGKKSLQYQIVMLKLAGIDQFMAQDLHQPVARTLLASNQQSQKLCDGKCRTQVRLFETIILLVILLLALWIGMNMLHILDAPTRFETEKKDQNRHQD